MAPYDDCAHQKGKKRVDAVSRDGTVKATEQNRVKGHGNDGAEGYEVRAADDEPGVTNLLTIYSAVTGKSIEEAFEVCRVMEDSSRAFVESEVMKAKGKDTFSIDDLFDVFYSKIN